MSTENSKQINTQPMNVVVVSQPKSVLAAFLLTFFFGPLGMLYSTIIGGIIMIVVSIVVGFLTLGFGLIVTQIICLIWSIIAVNSYNNKLTAKVTSQ